VFAVKIPSDVARAAALFLMAGGCSSPAPPQETGTFTGIYALLFPVETKAQCNSCHAVPANEVTSGLLCTGHDQASAYAALVGMTSVSKRCSGKALIVPGQPDASLFLQKLLAAPPCGEQMPLGGGHLPQAQVDLVRSWIAAGAPDD
jgi:hypothetical protein